VVICVDNEPMTLAALNGQLAFAAAHYFALDLYGKKAVRQPSQNVPFNFVQCPP
jgi:hypothetical protein